MRAGLSIPPAQTEEYMWVERCYPVQVKCCQEVVFGQQYRLHVGHEEDHQCGANPTPTPEGGHEPSKDALDFPLSNSQCQPCLDNDSITAAIAATPEGQHD